MSDGVKVSRRAQRGTELGSSVTIIVTPDGDDADIEGVFRDMISAGPAGVAAVQQLADALVEAGYPLDNIRTIMFEQLELQGGRQ